MKSKWSHLKDEALVMRRSGMSMTIIERKLGIARSTLSLWFKKIELTETQKLQLATNRSDGWTKARLRAVESHRAQKEVRLLEAKQSAIQSLSSVSLDESTLDLALAMLYFGEGAKSGSTSIANSDPMILNFVLKVLEINYGVTSAQIRCDLHLRMDQDATKLKMYWSETLSLPLECFKYVAFDKRSEGKPTYDHYKGVCVVTYHNVALRRKLTYLYTLFCDKVSELNLGT